MNRHSRRKSISEFRHSATRSDVITYLIDADDAALVREPWLLRAVLYWRGNIANRKPKCAAACGTSFAADGVSVGGYLIASPEGARAVSISAFCAGCWISLDDAELERVAVKVLKAVKPEQSLPTHQHDGDAGMIIREGRRTP